LHKPSVNAARVALVVDSHVWVQVRRQINENGRDLVRVQNKVLQYVIVIGPVVNHTIRPWRRIHVRIIPVDGRLVAPGRPPRVRGRGSGATIDGNFDPRGHSGLVAPDGRGCVRAGRRGRGRRHHGPVHRSTHLIIHGVGTIASITCLGTRASEKLPSVAVLRDGWNSMIGRRRCSQLYCLASCGPCSRECRGESKCLVKYRIGIREGRR
jgi:hypothetical protein